jgi:hypothetical protein
MRHGIFPVLSLAATCLSFNARAQTAAPPIIEESIESRFQLDFHVSDAALKKFLPAGWDLAVAPSGPAKDCNLRVIFIDRESINGPDGKPVGKGANQIVYLAVPMKEAATGSNAQVVIAGLTADAADVPGPFGVYQPATDHQMVRSTSVGKDGVILEDQTWGFTAGDGEHIDAHVKYERVASARGRRDATYVSAVDPKLVQVAKTDSGINIARNASVEMPDRVKEFRYKISGGRLKSLFDGTEKVLSIDFFPWNNLSITSTMK